MTKNYEKKDGPAVSVIVPTYNRPQYLLMALTSVLQQSYRNLQVIVVNDGGEDVGDIINSFGDPRVKFINRKENRGKPYSLNEALNHADGKYIAYLDDDDIYYPNHIETLVNALEFQTDCQVAYSDFYKTYCRITSDGGRQVLSKVVDVSRDFDRFFMLLFNHVLHVSLMHHRDLIEKTGPYNEQLNVLIDWDMTRRLVFFSDFHHVHQITGEYYHPEGDSNRISVQRRKDKNEYTRNVLTIRTTRPPKPWPKMSDLSIIFLADRLDKQAGKTISSIWQHTFYPYRLYLPLPASDINRLNSEMPNLIPVPVNPSSSQARLIDTVLEKCDSEYIAMVMSDFPANNMWIENPLYALMNNRRSRWGYEPEGSTSEHWAAVVTKDDLQLARRSFPDLPVRESLKAAGIVLKHPEFEEMPFQLDNLLQQAFSAEKNMNFSQAGRIFEYIAENNQNVLWMKRLAAKAFFKAGDHTRAAELCHNINRQHPTVDTFLLEAKIKRQKEDFNSAIELLKKAEQILENPLEYLSGNYEFSPAQTSEHEEPWDRNP
jgi:glycosyltransferase involved in cell wall biosynthesis